jgi:hypothetical protein
MLQPRPFGLRGSANKEEETMKQVLSVRIRPVAQLLALVIVSASASFAQLPFVRANHVTHLWDARTIQPLNLPAVAPAAPTPVCVAAPAVGQLRAFGFYVSTDAQDAASLNLTFGIGNGGGNFTKTSQVVAYRTGQTFECPSTDGKYTVVYGSEFDSGVEIDQQDIAGKASFAVVAANVTINNSNTQFSFSASGFQDDSPIRTAGAKMAGDVINNGLSVLSFKDFNTDFGGAINAAATAKVQDPPIVIGWRPVATGDVAKALAQVYALGYIVEGRGCEDAIKDFPLKTPDAEPAIRSAYSALSAGTTDCDASDTSMQSMAKQLLSGQRIKLP